MAKCLFKQSKCSLWNIKCGNTEYIYRFAHKHSIGCTISGWSDVSGVATALTKKYQKKLMKVRKLTSIVTLALAVFKRSVSKALKDGRIDEQEFNMLSKKYQKKLSKVTKLTDIVTSALAVFKMSVSNVLNNHKIDEREFATLQTLHLGVLNELANIDQKMEAETRVQLQKSLLEEIKDLREALRGASQCAHSSLCAIFSVTTA